MDCSPGITTVYKPSDKTTVDIIFIHSFQKQWQATWRKGQGQAGTWPQDLLPRDIPHARIGCWGCWVDDVDLLKQSSFQATTDRLLEAVIDFRKEDHNRKLIFAAHSFSGVVLKAALADSKRSFNSSLMKPLAGLLFFSVPEYTASMQWATFICNAYLSSAVLKNDASLAHREESLRLFQSATSLNEAGWLEVLSKTTHDFVSLLADAVPAKTSLCCLYEESPVYRSGVIVPKDHAITNLIDVASNEDAITDGFASKGIDANHFDMTKIGSGQLYDSLCQWLNHASGSVEHIPRKVIPKPTDSIPTTPKSTSPDIRGPLLASLIDKEKERPYVQHALMLQDQGHYTLAEAALEKAVKHLRLAFGDSNLSTLLCRDELVYSYWTRGKLDKAQSECEDIINKKQSYHRKNTGAMLPSARNLAIIRRSRGEYKKAYDGLLEKLEDTSGDTFSFGHITSLHLLARLLQDRRHFKFAEYITREVVQWCHEQLGSENPYTLRRMADLAGLLSMRQSATAEDYLIHAYKSLEEQLGTTHPDVLLTAEQYAIDLRYRDRVSESLALLRSLKSGFLKNFGREHPAVLRFRSSLAAVHILQGASDKGIRMLERTLDQQTAFHGEAHNNTIWTRDVLAQLKAAEPASLRNVSTFPAELRRLLIGYTRKADPDDKDIVTSMPEVQLSTKASYASKIRVKVITSSKADVDAMIDAINIKALVKSKGGFCGTLLHAASWNGSIKLVQCLLENGAEVTDTSGVFRSPVKAATMRGHHEILRLLLEKKGALSMNPEQRSLTIGPLETATVFGDSQSVELLRQADADTTAPASIFGDALLQAVNDDNVEIASALLKRNKTWQRPSGIFQDSPLQTAANKTRKAYEVWRKAIQETSAKDTANLESARLVRAREETFEDLLGAAMHKRDRNATEKRQLKELAEYAYMIPPDPAPTPPPPYAKGQHKSNTLSPLQTNFGTSFLNPSPSGRSPSFRSNVSRPVSAIAVTYDHDTTIPTIGHILSIKKSFSWARLSIHHGPEKQSDMDKSSRRVRIKRKLSKSRPGRWLTRGHMQAVV